VGALIFVISDHGSFSKINYRNLFLNESPAPARAAQERMRLMNSTARNGMIESNEREGQGASSLTCAESWFY
jgi:hypothetical protein